MNIVELMQSLGVPSTAYQHGQWIARTPIDGSEIGRVDVSEAGDVARCVARAQTMFERWRDVPAPRRGELVRLLGEELRAHKPDLGRLVSLEVGKIGSEGAGEVQEMIDICDYAVGLSRQIYGLTMASERPSHRMMETWHPIGPVGVITAFNFPVAVWAWNAALALVCGNPVIWKPSEKTPLCALAVQALFARACERNGDVSLSALSQLLVGDDEVGRALVDDPRVALVSATGSSRMGRAVAPRVAARFGRCLLELGGNNAIIVAPSADLNLATRAILFGAAGTAGQRCTSTRRLIVHESVHVELMRELAQAYRRVRIGNPLDADTLIGPLIDGRAFADMQRALAEARADGGTVHGGERVLTDEYPLGWYVRPALVDMPAQTEVVCRETFAPILYVLRYRDFPQAVLLNNSVRQGLSSSIFTNDLREAERFLSSRGSDCGIVNVNIGTSGAEVGGAFGGEKETGGGRESGSDSWRNYMRRATNTVNYSDDVSLAQGVQFGVSA